MDTPKLLQQPALERHQLGRVEEQVTLSEMVEQVLGFVRRQYPIFVLALGCCLTLGLIYLFTAPPKFNAHAMLMIDSSKVRILQQQQTPLGDVPIDTAHVETQVEVLKSENLALSVIKDQHLGDDPEFVGGTGGFLGALISLPGRLFNAAKEATGASNLESEQAVSRNALGVFTKNRSIARVGRTYVLDIGFSSLKPAKAAAIANAIADAYIVDQLETKYQATKRASGWLQDRLTDLRSQALTADREVLQYKEHNKIVTLDTSGKEGSGRLLGEQQLAEVTSQLTTARGSTGEAKARLERIQDIMSRDVPDAAVADSLHNEVITRLRNQYLDLAARESIWSARYGRTHMATVNLRTQMDEVRHSIVDELGRIAESYKSDYEIAKGRQDTLEKELANLVSEGQVTNRDRLGLRELESSAAVYHTIYDSFLQRYMEAIQQQSFPITEARVISAAAPPLHKSSPDALVVLTIAGFCGFVLSFAAAALREALDRVFRSTRQVEDLLKANCLTVLPSLQPSTPAKSKSRKQVLIGTTGPRSNLIAEHVGLLTRVVDEPLSPFAEAVRSVKVSIDLNAMIKDSSIIGVTSTLPREGKSTVASNLAALTAHAGKRAILIDGDLRNPTLTRTLAPRATSGIVELLSGASELKSVVWQHAGTGLHFLPTVLKTTPLHTNEILASEAFRGLIQQLRKSYDYVIVDLPPVVPVVDARSTIHYIDCYLYVVEWGKTRINVVQHQLASAPELHARLLGVVLNKAKVSVLSRYESYYSGYYRRYYARYGYGQ